MKRLFSLSFALLLPVFTSGCYVTHIRSGRAAAPGEPAMNQVLRSQIVADVVTVDPPDKLPSKCPEGWASIDSEVTPYNWLLDVVAGWFYRANTITIRCAAQGSAPPFAPTVPAVPPLAPPPPPPPPPPADSGAPAIPPPPPGFTPM